MRFAVSAALLFFGVGMVGGSAADRPAPEAPIVVPGDVVAVEIPETIRSAARVFDLDLKSVPVFHDGRNILELSYYGNRRGVPLPGKVSVLIETGCKRFWLADQFPEQGHDTTVVGPFEGNAIERLDLPAVLRGDLGPGPDFQAINGLLRSGDAAFVKLGLEAVPSAMAGSVTTVHGFLHYIERWLPSHQERYAEMGFGKQVEAALLSMEEARERIWAATVQPPARRYQAGFDPTREQRHGIGVLPEEAWGEEKGGLQAALATPKTLELNERFPLYFVFRNVSDATLRITIPEITGNLRLQYASKKNIWYGGTEGIGGHRQPLTHWTLEPGHQAMVLCRDLQIMAKRDLVPQHAYEDGIPGKVTVWASSSSRDEWKYLPDGGKNLVAVPDHEWKGSIQTAKRAFELLATEAPVEPVAPRELAAGHGVAWTTNYPETLRDNSAFRVELRPSVWLYLDHRNDAHWLQDHSYTIGKAYWGPMRTDQLEALGLFAQVEEICRELLTGPSVHGEGRALEMVRSLLVGERPLAALGLQLVPELKLSEGKGYGSAGLARTIRARRLPLIAMDLEKEMRTALELVTKSEPPLPPDDQFTVVADGALPAELPEDAWGPADDGLSAAALMPKVIKDGELAEVRLFLRNTSERLIHLTVSDRPGFDYATARDPEGTELSSDRPYVYPPFFSGALVPEYYPGQSRCNPPLVTLTKLLLKPGAVYELKTPTALSYHAKKREPGGSQRIGMGADLAEGEPAVTYLTAKPTEALVTWHLHTTHGAEYSEDLKRRLWPAKGCWSGPLRTAPIKVSLQAEGGEE